MTVCLVRSIEYSCESRTRVVGRLNCKLYAWLDMWLVGGLVGRLIDLLDLLGLLDLLSEPRRRVILKFGQTQTRDIFKKE